MVAGKWNVLTRVHVVVLVLLAAAVNRVGCGKADGGVAKKEMRRLSAGLVKIGVTEDQVEGIEALARDGGNMYLSFLSGRTERRQARELLKQKIPMLKISKKTIDGSKCLKLKLRVHSAVSSKGSRNGSTPSSEEHSKPSPPTQSDPAPGGGGLQPPARWSRAPCRRRR